VCLKICCLCIQGAAGKDGDVGAPGPSGPAVSKTTKIVHAPAITPGSTPYKPEVISL